MATGASFAADMAKWGASNKERVDALVRQSIQEMCITVQNNSAPPTGPNVVTAFFINNWQPSIGAPPPMKPKQNDGTAGGQKDSDAELSLVIAGLEVGDVFYYANATVYGPRLNWGFTGADALGRNVHQKGLFFMEKSLAQWDQVVTRVAADLRFSP